MPKIYQLPPHEAHKIAAGEVVDRPANVVKELLENGLDAGATAISVYIANGGRDLIRIVDNGCGMSPEDAQLCILNHATSKIRSVDDLDTLETFGFRGEALAAIAAVSHFTLTTREASADTAYRLEVRSGQVAHAGVAAAPIGTEIVVRDLFYNMPARQKFLKSRETEWRAIQQLCTAVALSHPALDIKLYHDDRVMLAAAGSTNLRERVLQVSDSAMGNVLVEFAKTAYQDGVIRGIVTAPEYMRYDRNQIFIFVNRRWVRAPKIAQSLVRGYLNALPSDRFPFAVIFIDLDPSLVDVNMHPRKEEVQFLHPRRLEQAIEQAVRAALERRTSARIANTVVPAAPAWQLPERQLPAPQPGASPAATVLPQYAVGLLNERGVQAFESGAMTTEGVAMAPLSELSLPVVQEQLFIAVPRIIGQLHRTYIQLESDEGLVLIDQHAAHERVLYELFESHFHELEPVALIVPEVVSILPADVPLIDAHIDLFAIHGFTVEAVGPHQYAITHTPLCAQRESAADLVRYMLGLLHELQRVAPEEFKKQVTERMRAQMACKKAVKGGDALGHDDMVDLVKQLYSTKNRFSCPHGRPTSWLISRTDIERKFRRS